MKKFYASLVALVTVASAVLALNFGVDQSQAQEVFNGRDHSTNAIIKGGALTRSELSSKVKNSKELQNLYAHFGISQSMINSGTIKEGLVYKNGNVTVGHDKVVATNAWSVGREYKAPNSEKFTVGGKSYYKRPTTNPNIFMDGKPQTAFIFFDKNGKYVGVIIKNCGNPVFTKPKPEPKPKHECVSLSRIKQDDATTYVFRGKATVANGAKYKGFTFAFGDGKSRYVPVQSTSDNGKYGYAETKYTYTKSGTYNVKVTAHFTVNGKEVKHTQANCAKPVTIKIKEAPMPVAVCKSLQAQKIDRDSYKLTATASTQNGATISQYTFRVGDRTQVVNSSSLTASATFDGLPVGSHKATVTVKTSVGDKTGADCEKTIKVEKEPEVPQPPKEEPKPMEVCDLKTGEVIEINKEDFNSELHSEVLADCDDLQVCIIAEGKVDTIERHEFDDRLHTEDLSECDEEEVLGEEAPKPTPKGEAPEVIAATGPAAIVGGLFGSSALGLGITSYVRSRRALSDLLR